MKKTIYYLILFLFFTVLVTPTYSQYYGTGSNKKTTKVKPYIKKNGTYINGYHRTKKNAYNLDNFNAKGNYNPYTSKYGKKKYKTQYNSLYKTPKSNNYNKNPYKYKPYKYKSYKVKSYKYKSYKFKTYKTKKYKY